MAWMFWNGTRWEPSDSYPEGHMVVSWYYSYEGFPMEPRPTPKDPWADISAESDPPGIICRPCSEKAHAECEGPALCHCQLCQIAPFIHELEEDWDNRDREDSWPR